jgi:DNA-binding IclR family transcriptional regulator
MSSELGSSSWTFLTNHTQVLLCIARDEDVRLRDVAQSVGITERAAQRIVADLVEAGYVERLRVGRRNRYVINSNVEMRHQAQLGHQIGDLLELLRLAEQPATS